MRQHRQNRMPVSVDPQYSVAGFLVDLLIGQTDMSGGALMTPVLILLFGVHPATAVGIDLLYASVTKTIGTLVHGGHSGTGWRLAASLNKRLWTRRHTGGLVISHSLVSRSKTLGWKKSASSRRCSTLLREPDTRLRFWLFAALFTR